MLFLEKMKLKLLANQKFIIVIQINNMSKTRKQKMGFIKTRGIGGWTSVPLRDLENYRNNVEIKLIFLMRNKGLSIRMLI